MTEERWHNQSHAWEADATASAQPAARPRSGPHRSSMEKVYSPRPSSSKNAGARRIYSAVGPAGGTSMDGLHTTRAVRSAGPARPLSSSMQLCQIIKEGYEGQPQEVQELLHPLGERVGPALLSGLRQQAVKAVQERDALAQELDKLRRSTRATRVSELEAEVFIYKQQLAHQSDIQQAMTASMEAANARAEEAEQRCRATTQALQQYLKTGDVTGPLSLQPLTSSSLSGRRKTRTLGALRSAHNVIIGQAVQLQRAFGGMKLKSVDELATLAARDPEVSGAGETLRYLLVHLGGLAAELRGLPGASDVARTLYPAPAANSGSGPSGGAGAAAGQRPSRNGVKGGDRQYLYPLPGPLPRQVSGSGELVLALMDHLHDLKAIPPPAQRKHTLHPLYIHDMETIASLSHEVAAEMSRLTGSAAPPSVSPSMQSIAQEQSQYHRMSRQGSKQQQQQQQQQQWQIGADYHLGQAGTCGRRISAAGPVAEGEVSSAWELNLDLESSGFVGLQRVSDEVGALEYEEGDVQT